MREKMIALVASSVIGLALLDQVLLSPLFLRLSEANTRITEDEAELARARNLFTTRTRAERRWRELAGATLKTDASAAESQLLNKVRDWAQGANLKLASLKPERAEKEAGFDKITIRAAGDGSLAQVSRFLYTLQTADIPVRVSDLTLTSRKPGTDELTLQVGIATIFNRPADAKPGESQKEAAR
jgi:hypothetical protein